MLEPNLTRTASLAACLGLCLITLAGAAGCSKQLTSSHLQRKPWQDGVKQNLQTKFFRFEFLAVPLNDQYGVKGAAHPLRDLIPPWADTVDDLTIIAYLSDENGNVLAKDQKSYLPTKFTQAGIPFDLFLKCKPPQGVNLYVSFGYRSMFVPSKPPKAGGQGSGNLEGQYVFFASEGAAFKQ